MSFTEFAFNVAHTSFKGVFGNVDDEKDNLKSRPHARVFSVCLNNHGTPLSSSCKQSDKNRGVMRLLS